MITKFKGMVIVAFTACVFLLIGQFVYGLDYRYYRYVTEQNIGLWSTTAGTDRFSYNYNTQQWSDNTSYVGWFALGSVGSSPVKQALGGNDPNFIGDGAWHSLGNGLSYKYYTQYDASNYSPDSGKTVRFSYYYGSGQWFDGTPYGGWSALGTGSVSQAYVRDGGWSSLGNGLSYKYYPQYDVSNYSPDGGKTVRFSYHYSSLFGCVDGQWFDYTPYGGWNALGTSSVSQAYIRDGAYHQLWSDGAKYKYLASNDYGYWSSSGVGGADDFRLSYSTGAWYRYYDGSTVYDNVEYKGNRQYLLTDYIYWTAAGLKSSTYTGSSYGTDVQNTLWYDASNYALANWYNFTPGSDLKWSGGALDVVVMNKNSNSLWMRSWEQYTKEDVLTIEYDLESGVSLSTVLQGLGYLTSVYGKTIDDLNVVCHGNYTGFYFGNWISTSNYTSYSSQWTQLNNLMTNGGQIQLSHCETGYAASMLNDIAARTNTRIFANINSGWTSMWALNWNYDWDDPNVWNYNYKNVFWGASARPSGSTDYTRPKVNFVDYDFEYQSDGSGNRGYKMLYSFYNPGYSQTNMVYWWNNGYGRR